MAFVTKMVVKQDSETCKFISWIMYPMKMIHAVMWPTHYFTQTSKSHANRIKAT